MYQSKDIIQKVKSLNLPLGKYIILGGASLAVRGIRETKDLDILVVPELFDELSRGESWSSDVEFEKKWNRKRLVWGDVEMYKDLYFEATKNFLDVYEIISKADMIDGIPFQPLEHLLMAKLDTKREKDLRDIELIKVYLNKTNVILSIL